MSQGDAYRCDRCKKVAFVAEGEGIMEWFGVLNFMEDASKRRHYCTITCVWLGEEELKKKREEVLATYTVTCPQHVGEWGKDLTCAGCVDIDGNPRPVPNA